MFEGHYLRRTVLQVGYPKIFSFVLNFVSFPILLNGIGLEEYGVFVYTSSIAILVEIFLDLGITSAWGKNCTKLRINERSILYTYKVWFIFQLTIAIIGFLLFLILGIFFISEYYEIYFYILSSLLLGVLFNFQKATLNAMLKFNVVAKLDLIESISRSLIFTVVGLLFKNVQTLAFLFTCSVFVQLVLSSLSVKSMLLNSNSNNYAPPVIKILRSLFKEAPLFLWLRLSTRFFHEIPILLLRNFYGEYIVGLFGSIRKLTEYLVIPFSIVGSILMYRGEELVNSGKGKLLLNNINIIMFLTLCFSPIIIVFEGIIERLFIDTIFNPRLFVALSMSYACAHIVFSLYAPISDYLGSLLRRNIFLSALVLCGIFILWMGSISGLDDLTMLYLIIGQNLILGYGYYLISRKAISRNESWPLLNTELMLIIQIFLTFFILFVRVFCGSSLILWLGLAVSIVFWILRRNFLISSFQMLKNL